MPKEKEEKKSESQTRITTRAIEQRIAQALARPGLKTKVVSMPNSVNFRVHWYLSSSDQTTRLVVDQEVESRFIAVHENEGKYVISDRTIGPKQKMADVAFDKPAKREPVIAESEQPSELPAAEADSPGL
jgi:uncharacterized membrane protein YvbJ